MFELAGIIVFMGYSCLPYRYLSTGQIKADDGQLAYYSVLPVILMKTLYGIIPRCLFPDIFLPVAYDDTLVGTVNLHSIEVILNTSISLFLISRDIRDACPA